MANLGNPFIGNVPRKISQEELIQALRVDLAGELEAIMAYDAHVLATDDQRVKTVLGSIRDEEKAHVGELLSLIKMLDPQESKYLEKGAQEVTEMVGVRM